MKALLLLVFVGLQLFSFSQIAFEEITSPMDFNIGAIRKSPTGEYFVQAANDEQSIYSSTNGQDWTQTTLPVLHALYDIQFFSDGTPILKPERNEHLIRRNGTWHTMVVPGADGAVEASFIREDTLFAYHDQVFAYSLDKGVSFTILFTSGVSIVDHTAQLWKFENHFVLHHTAGASDYLSVFNQQGVRVRFEALSIGIPDFLFNQCGEVFIYDWERYYLLKEQGLSLQTGLLTDIFPVVTFNMDLFAQNDHYYLRYESTLYRSINCDFTWETFASNELLLSNDKIWIDPLNTVLLFNNREDFFVEKLNGSPTWDYHDIPLDYAWVNIVNESGRNHQIAHTTNALHHKKSIDANWTELDTTDGASSEIHYSPDGDLYVARQNDILFSTDNGHSFTSIELPEAQFQNVPYAMEVLDNDILFLSLILFGQCFYSLNNGKDWIEAPFFAPPSYPLVKWVNNYILVAFIEYEYEVIRINVATNEATPISLGDFYSLDFYGSAILDDGTIYFQAFDFNGSFPEGLFRYRFGENVEFIGQFEELSYNYGLAGSGSDLFSFDFDQYHVFDGETLETYLYEGLPLGGDKSFMLADNDHLYVTIDHHRIFRSIEPLSYPQFISGVVHHDINSNCLEDTLDTGLKSWQVKVENDEFLWINVTDNQGSYNISVPGGQYSVSSQPISDHWDLCTSSYTVTVDDVQVNAQQDFQAIGLTECAELEIDFSTPLLRRCFDNYYSIRVHNTGPEASAGTTLRLELDPFFEFSSATFPYVLEGDSVLLFDLGILELNEEINFRVFFKLSCDAGLGMEHCLTGSLNDEHICDDPRSTYTECQENIGSFDPNDKRTFNEGGRETQTVDKEEYIYYHIRFQNTGTDTAFKVRVVDPLSSKLDLSTLEMLSASHPYDFSITDGPALEIIFDHILLPDSSTNEPASHGFFKFRIKPHTAFDYGTVIPNHARIYFDFNDPVITNNASMVIQQPVRTNEALALIGFEIHPNPASNLLYLQLSPTDDVRVDAYEIIDHQGRSITSSTLLHTITVPVAQLAPGVYNLLLKEDGGIIGMKPFVRL